MDGGSTPTLAANDRVASGPELLRILAVVGSEGTSSLLPTSLAAAGFAVTVPEGPDAAVALARQLDPHAVLVDLAATGAAGFELCRELRTFSVAYIVMLGGRDDDADRRLALSVGIDEYVDRLASSREVIARLQAMLSRPVAPAPDEASAIQWVGDLAIDLAGRKVRLGSCEVHLTRTEFDLLATLVSHPCRTVERAELLQLVWDTDWTTEDHLIDVHMSNLRRKLGDSPTRAKYVRTVRGVGYRVARPPTQGPAPV